MKQIGRIACVVWATACIFGQSATPSSDLLTRFHSQMLENMTSQPNYTCLETVERSRQAPGGGVLMTDTLRLDVALVDGKEMFAWPGSKQFEDKHIRDLIATGMFGNGNYGLYSRMLFGGGGPPFEYRGEFPLAGRAAARYDFRVQGKGSGYELSVDGRTAIVGFHGSAYIDPATGDLRRLEIYADDIPVALGLSAAEDRVDYARIAIGGEKFLLPVESALLMASKTSISRNRVRFSGCHKFAGESSLIFDESEPQDEEEAAVEPPVEVPLPLNTSLVLEIRNDLSLEKAAIGDAVTALLKSDVKTGKQILIKKGATATGRIILLERFTNFTLVSVEFHELEWLNGHASFNARMDRSSTPGIVGVGRVYLSGDGMAQFMSPIPRTLRGAQWIFRTVE